MTRNEHSEKLRMYVARKYNRDKQLGNNSNKATRPRIIVWSLLRHNVNNYSTQAGNEEATSLCEQGLALCHFLSNENVALSYLGWIIN
jgi:hypothetical protein